MGDLYTYLSVDQNAGPPLQKWKALQDSSPEVKQAFSRSIYLKKSDRDQIYPYEMKLAVEALVNSWTDQEVCNLLVAFHLEHRQTLLDPEGYQGIINRAKFTVYRITALENIRKALEWVHGRLEENTKILLIDELEKVLSFRIEKILKYTSTAIPVFDVFIGGEVVRIRGETKFKQWPELSKEVQETFDIPLPHLEKKDWNLVYRVLNLLAEETREYPDKLDPKEVARWIWQYYEQEAKGHTYIPKNGTDEVYSWIQEKRPFLWEMEPEKPEKIDYEPIIKADQQYSELVKKIGSSRKCVPLTKKL